jgi:hypothetical protein
MLSITLFLMLAIALTHIGTGDRLLDLIRHSFTSYIREARRLEAGLGRRIASIHINHNGPLKTISSLSF